MMMMMKEIKIITVISYLSILYEDKYIYRIKCVVQFECKNIKNTQHLRTVREIVSFSEQVKLIAQMKTSL